MSRPHRPSIDTAIEATIPATSAFIDHLPLHDLLDHEMMYEKDGEDPAALTTQDWCDLAILGRGDARSTKFTDYCVAARNRIAAMEASVITARQILPGLPMSYATDRAELMRGQAACEDLLSKLPGRKTWDSRGQDFNFLTDKRGPSCIDSHPLTNPDTTARHIDIGTVEDAHTLLMFMGSRVATRSFHRNLRASLSERSSDPSGPTSKGVPAALVSAAVRLEELMDHYNDLPGQSLRTQQWLRGNLVPEAVRNARKSNGKRS